MLKRIVSVVLIVTILLSVIGCSPTDPVESSKDTKPSADVVEPSESSSGSTFDPSKVKIGMAFPSLDTLFFQGQHTQAVKMAGELGFDLIVTVADNDANKQLQQCEDLINQGIDALLSIPVDKVAIMPIVDECYEKGIPYISVSRMAEDETKVSLTARGDNYDRAFVCIEYLAKVAKEKGIDNPKIIGTIGNLTDQAAVERNEGFVAACKEFGFEIVGEIATDWDPEKAYNRFNDLLRVVDDFDAIFLASDLLMSSILSVLEKEDKLFKVDDERHILIGSCDADPYAIFQVLEGYVDLTAAADAFDIVEVAVNGALDILAGNPPTEKVIWVPNNAVTTENVEQIIANRSTYGTYGLGQYIEGFEP